MIDHDVGAAFGAEALDTHLTAFVAAEKLFTFCDFHGLGFPQSKGRDWGAAVAPAAITMTITHLDRFARCLNHDRSAKTFAYVFVRHGSECTRRRKRGKRKLSLLLRSFLRSAGEDQEKRNAECPPNDECET